MENIIYFGKCRGFGKVEKPHYLCSVVRKVMMRILTVKVPLKIIIMRKTIFLLSASVLTGSIPICVAADDTPALLKNVIRGKTTGTKKTTVSKKSKDPVNIPISTGRFRPTTEGNGTDIFCFYWQRKIVLGVSSDQGEIRVLIKSPDNRKGRLYRLSCSDNLVFPVSGENGSYSVEVKTTAGTECTFLFELTD